jgi:ABC-type multidrug transport system ATPase subunit
MHGNNPPLMNPASAPLAGPRDSDELAAWPPIELYDVHKRWRKDMPLIDGINLTIEPGEVVWLGGANGAGKTTLLRIVAGLIDPTHGEIRAFGLHPFRERRQYHRRVAFLSAGNTGIYARLSVRGQLDCWARVAFVPREDRARIVDETLERFGLAALARQRSDRLSMGQRQRLRIAMTFIGKPDVVLLDEPRNSLDAEGAATLHAAIAEVAERGGGVLWVSPTGEQLRYDFAARYILSEGRLSSV